MKRINSDRDLMTPREVAKASGLGLRAVYDLIKDQHMPSISIGKDFLVPRPQYQHWLETVHGTFAGPTNGQRRKRP